MKVEQVLREKIKITRHAMEQARGAHTRATRSMRRLRDALRKIVRYVAEHDL